jgi:hypothetical protein
MHVLYVYIPGPGAHVLHPLERSLFKPINSYYDKEHNSLVLKRNEDLAEKSRCKKTSIVIFLRCKESAVSI